MFQCAEQIDDFMYLIISYLQKKCNMKEMLYAVRCLKSELILTLLKSNEDMILSLAGQFKQLSHEPEKFR